MHKEAARTIINERLEYFRAEYMRLDPVYDGALRYGRVTIRNQRSRWGSCSANRNLNFNYRLALLAPELRDYVIVHELCHLIEPNHSKSFWDQVARTTPNHKTLRKELRRYRF